MLVPKYLTFEISFGKRSLLIELMTRTTTNDMLKTTFAAKKQTRVNAEDTVSSEYLNNLMFCQYIHDLNILLQDFPIC